MTCITTTTVLVMHGHLVDSRKKHFKGLHIQNICFKVWCVILAGSLLCFLFLMPINKDQGSQTDLPFLCMRMQFDNWDRREISDHMKVNTLSLYWAEGAKRTVHYFHVWGISYKWNHRRTVGGLDCVTLLWCYTIHHANQTRQFCFQILSTGMPKYLGTTRNW